MDLDAVVQQAKFKPGDIPPDAAVFNRTLAREPQISVDVTIPFLRSFISGLFAFGFVGMLCIGLDTNLVAAGGIGFLVACLFWFFEIWAKDKMLWAIEFVRKEDVNRDGYIGRPPPTVYELRMKPGQWIRGELPIPDGLLLDWAKAAISGESLAYSTWDNRFALPNGVSGRDAYAEFRSELVRQGLGKEVGGNVGFKLTRKGMAVMGGFSMARQEDATPLLDTGAVHQLAVPHTDIHTGIQGGR